MSLYDSLEFSSSSLFLCLLTSFAFGQRIREIVDEELPIPQLKEERQGLAQNKNGTLAKNLTAQTVENANAAIDEALKMAPHTLEGIRTGKNGTMDMEMEMMGMMMEGHTPHDHNHPHSSAPPHSSPLPPTRPPKPQLLPFELPLPIELLEESISTKTTQKPTTTPAMTTTTTTAGQIRLPQPIQPEGPVVLPAPLGDCVDGHENCPFWAKNGFCQNHFYSQQTRARFCPSSCGLC